MTDPHMLMVGRTKTGKSVVLTALLAQAVASEWWTYVLDPKGSDYVWSRKLPGAAWYPVEQAQDGLTAIHQEMVRRRAVLAKIQETHDEIRNYTEAIAAGLIDPTQEPPVLVLIDEMAELVELGDKDQNKAAMTMLGRLARLARFVDIFLVVATQRPDATLLPGEVKSNLGTRGCTGEGDGTALRMAFGEGVHVDPLGVDPATGKPPKGRGRIMIGASDPIECQFAYIAPAAVKAAAGVAQDSRDHPASDEVTPDPTLEEMFSQLDQYRATAARATEAEDDDLEAIP